MAHYTNNIATRDFHGLKAVLGLSVLPLELAPLEGQQKKLLQKSNCKNRGGL